MTSAWSHGWACDVVYLLRTCTAPRHEVFTYIVQCLPAICVSPCRTASVALFSSAGLQQNWGVGTQVLYKQNDPYTIRVDLMYAGSSVLRVTFMYKGSILCTTDPQLYYKGQSYVKYIKLSLIQQLPYHHRRVNLMYSTSRAISQGCTQATPTYIKSTLIQQHAYHHIRVNLMYFPSRAISQGCTPRYRARN